MDAQKTHATQGAQSPAPQIFNFESVTVRTFNLDGEIWFSAADVCAALGIANYRQAVSRLDDDEARVISADTPSKNQHGEFGTVQQEILVISESGLYSLTLTSRKAEAKAFKRWVTHDVLPTIRKEGLYIADGTSAERAESVAGVDVRALLMENFEDPKVPIPEDVEEVLNQRTWDLTREAHELIREHLRKKVAYSAEHGYPKRVLDKKKAMEALKKGDLGDALARRYYEKLEIVEVMAGSFARAGRELLEELDAMKQTNRAITTTRGAQR